MTFLTQNKTSMIAGTALLTIALAFGGYSYASHSFEAGVAEGTIPNNTHIRPDGTYMESIPLFYINTVNNAPDYCVFHAHIPDPLNGGAVKVTDIDLINLSETESVKFSAGHVVDINVQQVLGNIGDSPYTGGPTLNVGPNPIFDLNDDDTTNDGLGHSSQIEE